MPHDYMRVRAERGLCALSCEAATRLENKRESASREEHNDGSLDLFLTSLAVSPLEVLTGME